MAVVGNPIIIGGSGGGGSATLGTKSISANGTYQASSDSLDGYSEVTVNVPNSYAAGDEGKVVSNGALVAQTSVTKTANGTYDTTLNNEVVVNVSGGGAIVKTLLYSFNESQGGSWINTEVDISDIETLMFEDVRSDVVQKEIIINVADIAVYTGGTDVYTSVYTQTKPMNARIYNNYLYVSYNGTGPSTNVTKIYEYAETSGGSTNILSGTSAPSSSDGSDGQIYLRYDGVSLPSGYTKLEYIESSGTQNIDTGVLASTINLVIESEINLSYTPSGNGCALWGGDWAADGYLLICYNGKFRWHSGGKSVDSSSIQANEWYSTKTSKTELVVDGVTFALSLPSGTDSGYNISLMTTTHSGSTGYKASAKYKRTKMYSGNTLLRDFIPAKDSNDVVGMYDIVNDVFYTNDGTGTFTAGSEITGNSIIATYLKVNGAWQQLIGSDIDDVNTGSEVNTMTCDTFMSDSIPTSLPDDGLLVVICHEGGTQSTVTLTIPGEGTFQFNITSGVSDAYPVTSGTTVAITNDGGKRKTFYYYH